MRILLVSFFLFACFTAKSQDIFKVHEIWTDATLWYKFNPKLKAGGDFGYRTTTDQFTFHQYYFRPTIVWRPDKLYSLSFAVSNFFTDERSIVDLNELRMAQQATLYWPQFGKIKLDHRVRFEERFFQIDDSKENSIRVRYRLGIHYRNFELFGWDKLFYTAFTWENFIGLANSFDSYFGDSQRWEFVFGNKLSDRFKLGLHYFFQVSETIDQGLNVQENVFRIRLGYTLNQLPKE